MSFFREAHDVIVNGGEFVTNQTTITNINGQSGIDILLEASTPEAAVDAGERNYAPSCYPDTRTQYIEDITNWATASNSDHLPIYWMKGSAGVGKSAIAQTCAQKLKVSGRLGAAFFFSINGRRKDHTRFFPTLAYQLATTLPDYRDTVNHCVLGDKTIVTKTIEAQFESLIVEPLRQLKEQGKEVGTRAVFIDGLDECEAGDAQVEIIKLIATSVRAKLTPFRWAIFSRPEPLIVSTFSLSYISPHCRFVYLPISRDSDKEIEIYLRGEFENILRRRNIRLSSPWPTDSDLRKLVDAAAGLFAYCAAVLRFIDAHSFAGFEETLQAVLEVIMQPGARPLPLFGNLDRLYTLILQRVPEHILPSMLLFFNWITDPNFDGGSWSVALYCNALGVSEFVFKSICCHLQAVIMYQEPAQDFHAVDPSVDPTQLWLDVHGTVSFLHKSFNDFLIDPDRSSSFCVSTDTMNESFLDRIAQRHMHFSSSYILQSSKLILAPGGIGSSASLSWPRGTESVDSLLKLVVFYFISHILTFNSQVIPSFNKSLSPSTIQRLRELDHRMSCVADGMAFDLGVRGSAFILYGPGNIQQIDGTSFRRIAPEDYDKFYPAPFLTSVKQLDKWGIIKAFRPHVPSVLASMRNSYSQTRPSKRYGVYEVGRGEKSVVWYWEFDPQERYYHEFWTTKYAEAMRIYKTEKFKMWKESWVPPS